MIRDDRIDILIDLAGHTAENRLLIFARKPAPVQITYLGYPNTTGMKSIDFRITDFEADPRGMTESQHSERLIRLPDGFLCFRPAADAPEPRDAFPSDDRGTVFGTFNNLAKITSESIDAWAGILREVDGSSLLLKSDAFSDPEVRERIRQDFASRGIDPASIGLLERTASARDHLALYKRLDIALDTFPYHGTTTTCEAMWMGVPVVTRAGRAHVSRVGASILHRVGLDSLIADSAEDYVRIAIALAADRQRLAELSGVRLRARMRNSRLMDEPGFARAFESAILKEILTP
jgi:predicted O-linked N-acetylglucosamine transferase (SPINDLY family)